MPLHIFPNDHNQSPSELFLLVAYYSDDGIDSINTTASYAEAKDLFNNYASDAISDWNSGLRVNLYRQFYTDDEHDNRIYTKLIYCTHNIYNTIPFADWDTEAVITDYEPNQFIPASAPITFPEVSLSIEELFSEGQAQVNVAVEELIPEEETSIAPHAEEPSSTTFSSILSHSHGGHSHGVFTLPSAPTFLTTATIAEFNATTIATNTTAVTNGDWYISPSPTAGLAPNFTTITNSPIMVVPSEVTVTFSPLSVAANMNLDDDPFDGDTDSSSEDYEDEDEDDDEEQYFDVVEDDEVNF